MLPLKSSQDKEVGPEGLRKDSRVGIITPGPGMNCRGRQEEGPGDKRFRRKRRQCIGEGRLRKQCCYAI